MRNCLIIQMIPRQLAVNIAPSILSANFAHLLDDCTRMLNSGAHSLHVDVMDGHFCNNLTMGPPILKSLSKYLKDTFFDCHIMVTNPQSLIDPLASAGAKGVTFHYEAQYENLENLCKHIREKKMKVGMALKPKTPVDETVRKVIKEGLVDMVLVMTVEPGFSGQKFMHEVMPKLKELRKEFPYLDIQVDGGVSEETIDIVAENGANCIVSGSCVFDSKNPQETISKLAESVKKHLNK